MIFHVFSIFPAIIRGAMSESILGKALERGTIGLEIVDIRDFAPGPHRAVDDYPYGGGPGMVMKPEPICDAVESSSLPDGAPLLLLSPQGETFDQRMAGRLAGEEAVGLVCGRYEGVDERVRKILPCREVSVGDFVLSGGEFAALVIMDAVARLVPGVLGDGASTVEESFSSGLLEYPQYTRPAVYRDLEVPEVLLSGDHGRIDRWRRRQSLWRTFIKRPDLLETADLTEDDQKFLEKAKKGEIPNE